ncbi:MAG: hypothetical protein NW206_01875 [Hyphomonadaceae bacterium]|nr:hypothetical protein [Hyphomonadaceae bacterium]
MWMGNVSAWLALAMAAMFAVNAYFQFATGVPGWLYVGTALILASGAIRTLRKMSGGLRLLAGAWGVTVGLLATPIFIATNNSPLSIAFVLIALAGLMLTVLHKEKK